MIQYVGYVAMGQQSPEVDIKYSKAAMKRMRQKGPFPEPNGAPIALNPISASSTDPIGSSSSAEYQRRLREEELLRLEQEKWYQNNCKKIRKKQKEVDQ